MASLSMGLDSVSVWDPKAALQGCWMECESNPKLAFSYPGNSDFFISGYRDDATRDSWYDNVLFFSCLDGCRSRHQAQRLTIIILPTIAAIIIISTLLFCCICRSCPMARCWKGDRYDSAYRRKVVPSPSPIMVNTVSGFNSQQGFAEGQHQGYPLPPGYPGYGQPPPPGYPHPPPPVANGYAAINNNCSRRRISILQRKLHNLDSTSSTLGIMAPEAAHYDPEAVARTAALLAQGGTRPDTRLGWVPEEGHISRIAATAKRRMSSTRNKKKSSGKIKIAET